MKKIVIDNVETEYSASECGNIFSHKRNKYLKPVKFKNGYLIVSLCLANGKIKQYLIHRLVAIAFINNPLNLPQVNHIDSNRENNSLDNLEWVTPKDNTQHKIDMGRGQYGEAIGTSVLTESQVLEIRCNYKDYSEKVSKTI
jgi:hypothetical protein